MSEMHDKELLAALGTRLRTLRQQANLTQRAVADRAGLNRTTVSDIERGKPTSTLTLIQTLRVMNALDGLTVLVPRPASVPRESAPSKERYRSLVWSNPAADDSTFIRAALRSPRAVVLADLARDFGLARLHQEWAAIKDAPANRRLAGDVERILGHLSHAGT